MKSEMTPRKPEPLAPPNPSLPTYYASRCLLDALAPLGESPIARCEREEGISRARARIRAAVARALPGLGS